MSDDAFFDRYGDLDLQRRMVSDRRRTAAFCRAVERVVQPGQRVLDLGCGSGILSLAAARAGAQVVAIDRARVVKQAARVAKAVGLGDRIRFLEGDVRALADDEGPFDGIVSEWLGNFAFVENMWPDLADARDRLVRPGGFVLPDRVRLWLAPVDDGVLYYGDGPGAWRRPVEGFDLSLLEDAELDQGLASQLRVDAAGLLCPAAEMMDLDLTVAPDDAAIAEGRVRFRLPREGTLHGFAGWFDVHLADGWFSTSPDDPETHWSQTYLPCRPVPVGAGDWDVHWSMGPDPDEPRHFNVQVDWGEGPHASRWAWVLE